MAKIEKDESAPKHLGELVERNITEYLHWIVAVAPIAAGILGAFTGSVSHYWEIGFATSAIAVNVFLLCLRSRFEENKELSLFTSFVTGNLPPPLHPAEELLFNTEVGIVEAKENSYFQNRLEMKFHTKPSDDFQARVDDRDERLRLRSISCQSIDEGVKGDELKKRIVELQRNLENDLSKSDAVIVVHTNELDQKAWVYKLINRWAGKNSEAPVLFVRPQGKANQPVDEYAGRFRWIRDVPKLLPWSLLQRAKDRASAWRTQATYNRALVSNFFFLALMFIWLAGIWIANVRTRHSIAMNGMHYAIETKELYQKETNTIDGGLDVSYWFMNKYWVLGKGKPYVFVTTESKKTQNFFENNEGSIIGCGFSSPSRVAEWKKGGETVVYDWADNNVSNHCVMDPRIEPITAIVCGAYRPSGNPSPEATVGICVFTTSTDAKILEGFFGDGTRRFLRGRIESFSKGFEKQLESGEVTALAERSE
jgi:hypothetical protein